MVTTNQALLSSYSLNRQQVVFALPQEQAATYDSCWFCWSGQAIDKSIQVKEYTHFYVCLDKGPIEQHHLQVVPKKHVSSRAEMPQSVLDELATIQEKVRQAFRSSLACETVFFEKHLPLKKDINHLVIHGVPTVSTLTEEFEVFNLDNALDFYPFSGEVHDQLQRGRKSQEYYLAMHLGVSGFIMKLDGSHYFRQKGIVNHDLLRQLLNHLLGKQQRSWRDLQLSPDQVASSLATLSPLL